MMPSPGSYDSIPCPACRATGRIDRRRCRACHGQKILLAGEPADRPYDLILDYSQRETQ